MAKPYFVVLLAAMLALLVSAPAPAKENPASLAQRELVAESRGDVAAALALYSDDAIVQYGGLCWTPCVGKAAIQNTHLDNTPANLKPGISARGEIYVDRLEHVLAVPLAALYSEKSTSYVFVRNGEEIVEWEWPVHARGKIR